CFKCFEPDLPVEHGLYVIKNVKTTIDNEDHVLATIPPGFSVRQSTIPNAGLGVFVETTIPSGTRLGPYDGTLSKDFHGDDWTYIFLNRFKDTVQVVINYTNKNRFRDRATQNIVSFKRTLNYANLFFVKETHAPNSSTVINAKDIVFTLEDT
ncbi:hypothetical protein AM593_04110, partial [Mytilus galloprovincialis]